MAIRGYVQPPANTGLGRKVESRIIEPTLGDQYDRQRVENYPADGEHVYGTATAVAPGATVTVVSFVAPLNWSFVGYVATGDADGEFCITFDGIDQCYPFRTSIVQQNAVIMLPLPDPDAGGTIVELKVLNLSDDPAAYKATILGILNG